MFKKSATEFKQKQKLIKYKSTIQIVTFDVRNLNRIGQLRELTTSVIDHNIEYYAWTFVSASALENSVNAPLGGVGLLIGPRSLNLLNSIEKIKAKMTVATFNGNPRATIISCYSPTNTSNETGLVTVSKELSSFVQGISKHNVLIISEYRIAQRGKNVKKKNSAYTTRHTEIENT